MTKELIATVTNDPKIPSGSYHARWEGKTVKLFHNQVEHKLHIARSVRYEVDVSLEVDGGLIDIYLGEDK